MSIRKHLQPLCAIATFAMSGAFVTAQAQGLEHEMGGNRLPPIHAPMGAPRMPPPAFGIPPQYAQLDLSIEQEDRLFRLFHQQAPAMHANVQRLRQAEQDIAVLTRQPQADPVKLRSLADDAAHAMADLRLLQLTADQEARRLLTPAQLEQLQQDRPKDPGRSAR